MSTLNYRKLYVSVVLHFILMSRLTATKFVVQDFYSTRSKILELQESVAIVSCFNLEVIPENLRGATSQYSLRSFGHFKFPKHNVKLRYEKFSKFDKEKSS